MTLSLSQLNEEFNEVLREVLYLCVKLNNTYDRVRTIQWVRKLRQQDDSDIATACIRNDYAHYLRIILLADRIFFAPPFKEGPPNDSLPPLVEALTNKISRQCPELPRTGPLQPLMCHKTEDGRAFMVVKKCPEGGILCYLAVAPHEI